MNTHKFEISLILNNRVSQNTLSLGVKTSGLQKKISTFVTRI